MTYPTLGEEEKYMSEAQQDYDSMMKDAKFTTAKDMQPADDEYKQYVQQQFAKNYAETKAEMDAPKDDGFIEFKWQPTAELFDVKKKFARKFLDKVKFSASTMTKRELVQKLIFMSKYHGTVAGRTIYTVIPVDSYLYGNTFADVTVPVPGYVTEGFDSELNFYRLNFHYKDNVQKDALFFRTKEKEYRKLQKWQHDYDHGIIKMTEKEADPLIEARCKAGDWTYWGEHYFNQEENSAPCFVRFCDFVISDTQADISPLDDAVDCVTKRIYEDVDIVE